MKRKWMAMLVVISLFVLSCSMVALAEDELTGSGTQDDPYQIATVEDLVAAGEAGGYAKLTASVVYEETITLVPKDGSLVLDLNNCTISSEALQKTARVYGELTITDNSEEKAGAISSAYIGLVVAPEGSLILEEGTVSGEAQGVQNQGALTLAGGSIQCDQSNGFALVNFGNTTMTGGTVSAVVDGDDSPITIYNTGVLEMEDGEILASGTAIYNTVTADTIEKNAVVECSISGGTVKSDVWGVIVLGAGAPGQTNNGQENGKKGINYDGEEILNDAIVLNISGDADIQANQAIGTNASNGIYAGFTINIEGGSVTGTGEDGCAMYLPAVGVTNISGGTIAGPQGIRIASGELTITGGTVNGTALMTADDDLIGGGSGGTKGAIVAGKASSGYYGDLKVSVSGAATVQNTGSGEEGAAAAIVVSDKNMGGDNYKDSSISVTVDGAQVTGDMVKVSNLTAGADTQDGGNTAFTVQNTTVNGNVTNKSGGNIAIEKATVTGTVTNENTGSIVATDSTLDSVSNSGTGSVAILGDSTVDQDKIEGDVFVEGGDATVAVINLNTAKLYETISEAVAEANDNDTIQIYSGTYKETLVLDKPLTLIGKGDVTLTFDGDTVFTSQAAIAGETTPYAGIVTATADVALKNITIKGNPEAANNNGMLSHTHRYAGVVALDANVTLENCSIQDITYLADLQGMQNGFGVYAVSTNPTKLILQDTTIANFNKAAAVLRAQVELSMDGCTVTGFGAQSVIAQNGIQYAGNAEIKNTEISGLQYTAENEWKGGSIAFYNVSGEGKTSTIQGVTCSGVDYAVATYGGTTEIVDGDFGGLVWGNEGTLTVSGGSFTNSVLDYVSDELKYELNQGEQKFTYYATLAEAVAAAEEGGVITSTAMAEGVASDTVVLEYTSSESYTLQLPAGETITLPELTRTGYNFRGWYQGQEKVATYTALGDQEVTFTAKWSRRGGSSSSAAATTYGVTLPDAVEHGSVSVDVKNAAAGDTVTITVTPESGYHLSALTIEDAQGNEIAYTDKGNGVYTFKMPDGKVSIDAVFAQGEAWSNPFSDVVEGAWYYEAVAYVCNNGLMNGVGGGYFEPNANLTRAMLVQVLYNLEQKPALDSEAGFTDVAADAWYADAVNWAAQNQVVNGYGGNAFGPEDALTREQMASILYRYATYKGYDTTEGGMAIREFADYESISDWASEAMGWAVHSGLLSGKGNNLLDPTGAATRGEVAQILMNFCKSVVK